MPYPVLIGRRTGVARDYRIRRLPYLYIIDQSGVIHSGDVFLKYDKIREKIEKIR